MNSKLSAAKKSKTTTFSRVFHTKKIDNFLGKSKLNFWTKNEDFEQCEKVGLPPLFFHWNSTANYLEWKSRLLLCTMVREIRVVEAPRKYSSSNISWMSGPYSLLVAKNLCPGKVFLCITCLSLPMGERRGQHFDAVSSSTPQWTRENASFFYSQ